MEFFINELFFEGYNAYYVMQVFKVIHLLLNGGFIFKNQ